MRLLVLIAMIKALLISFHAEAARPGCLEVMGAYTSAGRGLQAPAAYRACESGESITNLLAILNGAEAKLLRNNVWRLGEQYTPKIIICNTYSYGTGTVCSSQ